MNHLLSASHCSFLHTVRKVSNWQAKSSEVDKTVSMYNSKESRDLAGHDRLGVKQDWDHVDKHCIRVHLVAALVRVVMPSVKY